MMCPAAQAATYYISSSTGSDTNSGTDKARPWAHAPGMNSATGNPAAYRPGGTPNSVPGDTFIFKGCDVWTWENFAWVIGVNDGWNIHGYFASNTSAGAGYSFLGDSDKTWYNTQACPNGWDRPVFDACKVSSPAANNLPGCTGSNVAATADNQGNGYKTGGGSLVQFVPNYVTISGFEMRNHYHGGAAFLATQYTNYGDVRNMYYHAWIEPTPVNTKATVSQGSDTITVTGSMAGIVIGEPVQLECTYCVFPPANSGPIVSAINGNRITVTDYYANPVYAKNNDCASTPCTLLGGWDSGTFTSIQGFPNSTGMTFEQNVIDGWDTALVQADPNCTPGYGNCLGSLTAFYQGPAIVRNNVVRYVSSYYLGMVQDFSGNFFEQLRVSINPTAHSNGMESLGDSGLGLVAHDNVWRGIHAGVPFMVWPRPEFTTTGSIAGGSTSLTVTNPQNSCGYPPCGFDVWWYVRIAGVGPGGADFVARIAGVSGNTVTLETPASTSVSNAVITSGGINPSYVWNNVFSDMTANYPIELMSSGNSPDGSVYVWNNSVEGGPDPNGAAPGNYPIYPMTTCPSSYQNCDFENNHFIGCAGDPGSPDCAHTKPLVSQCGSNCAQSGNVVESLNDATARGIGIQQANYFSPSLGSPTIGAGNNLSSRCSTVLATGPNFSASLAGLCSDTNYAVSYDLARHRVIIPARQPNARPATGPWDAGAYQYQALSILYGDVSGNGTISVYDAALALRADLSSDQQQRADVTNGGGVTGLDAALIAQRAVGLIGKFPVEG